MRMSRTPYGIDCLPALASATNITTKLYRPLARRIIEALLTLNPVVAAASLHNKAIIVDHRRSLIGRPLAPATVNRRLSAVRGLARFL
ncbi:MAG: hypothetical protein M3255_07710 [Pseudomonadota bacterium]|nr:hypothetical protein [Pseudomonadota bacterium]